PKRRWCRRHYRPPIVVRRTLAFPAPSHEPQTEDAATCVGAAHQQLAYHWQPFFYTGCLFFAEAANHFNRLPCGTCELLRSPERFLSRSVAKSSNVQPPAIKTPDEPHSRQDFRHCAGDVAGHGRTGRG